MVACVVDTETAPDVTSIVCLTVPDALPALKVMFPEPLEIFSLKVITILLSTATLVAPSDGLKDDVVIGPVVKL